jgi:AAA domain, putative AbiEii toxin, Type IV TA system
VIALEIPINRPLGKLSGGQQAQIALVMALAKRPQLLLLDEPIAALDPLAQRAFFQTLMDAVVESGITVLFSSHQLADLDRICDGFYTALKLSNKARRGYRISATRTSLGRVPLKGTSRGGGDGPGPGGCILHKKLPADDPFQFFAVETRLGYSRGIFRGYDSGLSGIVRAFYKFTDSFTAKTLVGILPAAPPDFWHVCRSASRGQGVGTWDASPGLDAKHHPETLVLGQACLGGWDLNPGFRFAGPADQPLEPTLPPDPGSLGDL